MKIQLIREVTEHNRSFYYITVDEKMKSNTVCDELGEALEHFEKVKHSITGKRIEVLMQETI